MNLHERFMAKVEKTESCWVWTARKTCQGYGRISVGNVNKLAHRVAFELFAGDVPNGLHVLHSCDNPSCVNPSHLWLGTNNDNVADKMKKGRAPSHVGEKNGNSRLTPEDVLAIRIEFNSGISRDELSRNYGIAAQYVNQIAAKKVWRHL